MYHHNTIRKYTLALLDFFNDIEVQYKNSSGDLVTKVIPVQYRNKEKNEMMDKSFLQEITGNMNILPRGTLNFSQMSRNFDRNASKFNKFTKYRDQNTIETMYNPVAYDFTFDMSFICRGMNEACQIIEQIAPKFNPNIAIDIYDSDNQDESTRIPVQLSDINQEYLGLDEYSLNIIRVSCILQVCGWLYQPIKEFSKIKKYKMSLQTPSRETEILNFDVLDGHPQLPPTITRTPDLDSRLYIKPIELIQNNNTITVKYETNSREKPKITFISDDCTIVHSKNSDTCEVSKKSQNTVFVISAILELNDERVSIQSEFNFS